HAPAGAPTLDPTTGDGAGHVAAQCEGCHPGQTRNGNRRGGTGAAITQLPIISLAPALDRATRDYSTAVIVGGDYLGRTRESDDAVRCVVIGRVPLIAWMTKLAVAVPTEALDPAPSRQRAGVEVAGVDPGNARGQSDHWTWGGDHGRL